MALNSPTHAAKKPLPVAEKGPANVANQTMDAQTTTRSPNSRARTAGGSKGPSNWHESSRSSPTPTTVTPLPAMGPRNSWLRVSASPRTRRATHAPIMSAHEARRAAYARLLPRPLTMPVTSSATVAATTVARVCVRVSIAQTLAESSAPQQAKYGLLAVLKGPQNVSTTAAASHHAQRKVASSASQVIARPRRP